MEDEVCQLLSAGRRKAAFEALLGRYQTKVFRLMYSMLGNAATAEDVTQDVFLKLWQVLPAYDGRASFSTWIYAIARNTALTRLRAESYRRTESLTPASEPATAAAPALRDWEISRLVARLPEEQRDVVRLFYLQDRSVDEVARMLDLPAGTVKSHLFRARKALAAMLEVKV